MTNKKTLPTTQETISRNKFWDLVEKTRKERRTSIAIQHDLKDEGKEATLIMRFIEAVVLVQYNTGQIELDQVLEEMNELSELVTFSDVRHLMNSYAADYLS